MIPASKRLWSIRKGYDGFYYEVRANGVIIDRIRIEEPALSIMKKEGLINE